MDKNSKEAFTMPMTKEAVREKMKEQNVVLLNVLPEANYTKSRIAGSKNLPLGRNANDFVQAVEKRHGKDKFFITYCADVNCNAGPNAARVLIEKGFRADDYPGGLKDWSDAGFPMEGTQAPNRRASDAAVVSVGSK
jgi:rhodanese-related sulfurtransferase